MPDRKFIHTIAGLILIMISAGFESIARDPIILEERHYSNVFGEPRNYRVFLPPGYHDNPDKKYPVVYFLHGWSQRYFGNSGGDDSGYAFDNGADNKGDNIANFVAAHDLIVVRPDGYNREPGDPYYMRPYNIGPVETFRQFPEYLPELVRHIDSRYNTIADREHRGICGLSMGGFMTYWIAGKYPHLFSAAGSFCGSAEFVVGPKTFPAELRLLDTYANFGGMNVRLHYGDRDFIRDYHADMIAIWKEVMDNFGWKVYPGQHATTGLGDMLSFMLATFSSPPPRPARWNRADVYPDFEVWEYQVTSDRIVPGFTILENVGPDGFRSAVREFLPDGELVPSVRLSVTTAPVYEKNQTYVITDTDLRTSLSAQRIVRSDASGRIVITLDGSLHEIGINKRDDRPNVTIASWRTGSPWAVRGQETKFFMKLLNKGLSRSGSIRATLAAVRKGTTITQGSAGVADIGINELGDRELEFRFRVDDDSLEITRLLVTLDYDRRQTVHYIDIPVKDDAAEMTDFEVADGRMVTVTRSGIDIETVTLGRGNGDGIANAGESIVILAKANGKLWRTTLTAADPYVNRAGVRRRMSDNWTDFDHVGASMKYDVPLISSDCPENHNIEFFAEFFLPEYPFHHRMTGKVRVKVAGKDETSPEISRVIIGGDNVVQAIVMDGGPVKSVRATFILRDDPAKTFDVDLNDGGTEGDRNTSDRVYSRKLPQRSFGIYRVIIEAVDAAGNRSIREMQDTIVLY